MLGIYAPYVASEITDMALGLAEIAHAIGVTVSWLAPVLSPDIHSGWDNSILNRFDCRLPLNTVYEWADRCSHVVSFVIDFPVIAAAASRLTPTAIYRNSVNYGEAPEALVRKIPSICQTDIFCRMLRSAGFDTNRVVPCEPHNPVVCKSPRPPAKLLIPTSSRSLQRHGDALFPALNVVLAMMPEMQIELTHQKLLPVESRNSVLELQRRHGPRISIARQPTHRQRMLQLEQSDLTLYLYTADAYCVDVFQSLQCGTPVVTLASQTTAELFDGHPGVRLIRTKNDSATDLLAVDGGYMTAATLADMLMDTLTTPGQLETAWRGNQHWLAGRRDTAVAFWRTFLGMA